MSDELVDVIKDGQVVTVSLSEAKMEGLFILRRHEKKEIDVAPVVSFSSRRDEYDRREILKKQVSKWHSYQPEYKKNFVMQELIENFHWSIAKGRRLKNLSRAQLAKAVGVPEYHIKMLENGELPSDDFILITKVEHVLGVKLRKEYPATAQQPRTFMPQHEAVKPHYSEDIKLAELQRRKEIERSWQKPAGKEKKDKGFSGGDIEIVE
ncbi:MAG: hypothetical protein AABX59_00430 [Nanoarchaeota archaeon]